VNRQITRLALTGVGLIVSLVVATTYWQTWAAGDLADRQDNQIERVAQFTIKRGEIFGSNPRRILGKNRPEKVGGRTLYFRRYPQGPLTAHIVGYSTQSRSRAGLERSLNDYLTGSNANLSTVLDTTLDRLKGATVKGNDVVLTLNLRAQKAAVEALDGRCGSVVALQPATGKLLVAANFPTYDPNIFEEDDALGRIARINAPCSPVAPLYNRATKGLYAPGSTFKVVTLSAALDTGRYTPESEFDDPGYCEVYGRRVNNYDTTSPFGHLNLREALVNSVNSVFCNIGKDLGAKKIVEYSKRFGFYSTPPLETPSNERAPSGLYVKGHTFDPKVDSDVDPGRFAFGQERLLVTPLQMAMVAATIANRGVLMRPYVVNRIVSPSGSIVVRTKPQDLGRAVKPETADAVGSMMRDVVERGTGTRAQISGVPVSGKTGTAETGRSGLVTTWFICFAGRGKRQVAVAVVLEQQRSGSTGGQTAAPVARAVLQALIGGAANS
jgi:peptidoglycan glycosyltransferase